MTIYKVSVPMGDVAAPSSTGFDPLPVGEYLCEVLEADIKQTSVPGRSQLAMQLRIAEGDYSNRRIFHRPNLPLETEGPETFIAQNFRMVLDAIPDCFNFETNEIDTDRMKGALVMVKTKNENDKRQGHEGELQTRVSKMYLPQDESQQPEAAPAAAPAPKTAAAPSAAPSKPAAPKAGPAKAPAKAAATTAPVQRAPFRRPQGVAS